MGEIEARKRAVSDAEAEFSYRAARERLSQSGTRPEMQIAEEASVEDEGGVWMVDDAPHCDAWDDPDTIALYADADDPDACEMSSKYLELGYSLGGHLGLSARPYQYAKTAATELNAAKALVPGLMNWAKLLIQRERLRKKGLAATSKISVVRDIEANIIGQLAFYADGFERVALHAKREANGTRAALKDKNLCDVARIKGEVIPTPKELERWVKNEATARASAARLYQVVYRLQIPSVGLRRSAEG